MYLDIIARCPTMNECPPIMFQKIVLLHKFALLVCGKRNEKSSSAVFGGNFAIDMRVHPSRFQIKKFSSNMVRSGLKIRPKYEAYFIRQPIEGIILEKSLFHEKCSQLYT